MPRRQRLGQTLEAVVDKPILQQIAAAPGIHQVIRGGLDPMLPAEYLLRRGRKARKIAGMEEALNRFEALFDDINRSR